MPTLLHTAERALGIDRSGGQEPFPAFTDLTTVVPARAWLALRMCSVLGLLALIGTLFVRPDTGLLVFFGVIAPVLPLVFLVAPGLWRNVCPLAASNQVPRLLGVGRARTAPEWLRRRGYLVGTSLFVAIVGARLAGLDQSGAATGAVLAAALTIAVAGGVLFKGKSGWCGTICPLLPLQRAYGQTPFVTVRNSHCPSCVGCVKNCYDFKPRVAHHADLADADPSWAAPRKLFVAALPGLVLGFFTLGATSNASVGHRLSLLALFVLVSVGCFAALDALTSLTPSMLSVGFAAAALNVFYWFCGPVLAGSWVQLTGLHADWLRWPLSVAVGVLTLSWVARTRVSELQYAVVTGRRTAPVLLSAPRWPTRKAVEPSASVSFDGGTPVDADADATLLDVAERAGQPIRSGCRMGVCGADPVTVVAGMACLSAPDHEELATLRRLGLDGSARMACRARVTRGAVSVSLDARPIRATAATSFDRCIESVVVIGNGIAGVTAADHVRRGHPDCAIHLIGREPHALYNRMEISQLLYGRSAMHGLYLLPEQWYSEQRVTTWLNTAAAEVDAAARHVVLGTGETLRYDRLILAMGASAALPTIGGLDRPGSFVLREAGDAMRIRSYVQQRGRSRAVVAGGGLLGLEAAYSLHLLGLSVTVLERGDRLLRREVDSACSALVAAHLARVGIEVIHDVEASGVVGAPDVAAVVLADGRSLPCDVFLAATGIRPNVELARRAGLPVGRGVLVDERMKTEVDGVFAAGDVAEQNGQVPGRWPVAMEQARVAAVNALGGAADLTAETPATTLKGIGLDLFSMGHVLAEHDDEIIVVSRPEVPSYRRLVLRDGRAVGATILGHHPTDLSAAQRAVRERITVAAGARSALRSGDWTVLASAS